jgi:hypothetical protein
MADDKATGAPNQDPWGFALRQGQRRGAVTSDRITGAAGEDRLGQRPENGLKGDVQWLES